MFCYLRDIWPDIVCSLCLRGWFKRKHYGLYMELDCVGWWLPCFIGYILCFYVFCLQLCAVMQKITWKYEIFFSYSSCRAKCFMVCIWKGSAYIYKVSVSLSRWQNNNNWRISSTSCIMMNQLTVDRKCWIIFMFFHWWKRWKLDLSMTMQIGHWQCQFACIIFQCYFIALMTPSMLCVHCPRALSELYKVPANANGTSFSWFMF